ncbi:MAG: CxxC-x17-CxxC domain-containing protein [Patescibacteria group bacterium]
MFKPQRDNSSGGWKGGNDFGRKKSWGRDFDNRRSDRPEMHKATCNECGNPCEVPFRPTGARPVYCDNCFKRGGNAGDRRPAFNDRPSFNKPAFRNEGGTPSAGSGQYNEQFKAINAKLDAILKVLSPAVLTAAPKAVPKEEAPANVPKAAKKEAKEKTATKKKKAVKAKK